LLIEVVTVRPPDRKEIAAHPRHFGGGIAVLPL
jgi:hypothetical protein